MATKYAEKTYPNVGGGTEFTIPFKYLEQSHLKVTLDAVTQVNGTDYTINETTSKVVFSVATPANDVVVISRTTPIATADLAVTFEDGSGLNAEDLNDSAQQTLFAVQELTDFHNDDLEGVGEEALFKVNNLSDLPSSSTARTNLGLGTIATQASDNVTITGGSVTGITDVTIADGGTGASDASTARTNLGLGTIATQDSNLVTITGGAISGITDLSIADGGTGASSKTVAFDNLSPTTTKGDLVVSNGSDNIRLGVGTNAYVLTSDSTETSGMKWADQGSLTTAASAYLGVSQVIASSTWTLIEGNTEFYDDRGWYDTSTYRYTPLKAGNYLVISSVGWVSLTAETWIYHGIHKNGVATVELRSAWPVTSPRHQVSCIVKCNGTTDYISAYIYHSQGSSASITNNTKIPSLSVSFLN